MPCELLLIVYFMFAKFTPKKDRRPRVFKRAVDRRADLLTSEYQTKARQKDWEFCGTPRPAQARPGDPQPVRQLGPEETKLNTFGRVQGWVFGAWGEASEDVHALVQRLAKARLERLDTLPTVRRRQVSRTAMLSALVMCDANCPFRQSGNRLGY